MAAAQVVVVNTLSSRRIPFNSQSGSFCISTMWQRFLSAKTRLSMMSHRCYSENCFSCTFLQMKWNLHGDSMQEGRKVAKVSTVLVLRNIITINFRRTWIVLLQVLIFSQWNSLLQKRRIQGKKSTNICYKLD